MRKASKRLWMCRGWEFIGTVNHFKNTISRCYSTLDGGYCSRYFLRWIEHLGKNDDVGNKVGGAQGGVATQDQIATID